MTQGEIPATHSRLVVTSPGKDVASCKIEVQRDVPVPQPKSGEVLIRVTAAPINPSDYGEWYRSHPSKYPLPMGKEGCGTVVATGGGLSGLTSSWRCPVGTPVGFLSSKKDQGSYSEYVTASATTDVFPMPADVPIEDCASFFVNPYTAVGILDTVKKEGSPAFVHTAAASQLGQMINKIAPEEGIDVINIVRREEQADILRKLGAEHIIVTGSSKGDDDEEAPWKEELKAKVKDLNATVAFDAVSGRMTGDLLEAMPPKSTTYIYGGLAGKANNIDPSDLIYRSKKLKGFFLTSWIKEGGTLSMVSRMMSAGKKVNAGLGDGGWSSTQFTDTTMDKAHEDIIKLLGSSITGKKLRLRFSD